MIKAITCFSPKGFEEYGQRMVSSFIEFWPRNVELVVKVDELPKQPIIGPNVTYQLLDNPGLLAFKERHASRAEAHGLGSKATSDGKANFAFDAVRFSHKVFAMTEEARHEDLDVLLWLDGDTRTHSPVNEQFIERLVPADKFAGFLDRPWNYTETGFHMFRMPHPISRSFFKMWEQYYLDDSIFNLPAWTDCHTYDAARKNFDGAKWQNLSPPFKHPHPFINGILGEVMDHMKGPRKQKGTSHKKDLVTERGGYWSSVT